MLKKMCSLVLCVALVATVFTAMPVFANLKPIPTTVSIVPNTQEVAAGGSFSVDVVVDSEGIPITACNVTVTFDADLTATGLTGADLLGTFGLDALYIPTIDVGEVSYGGARIDGPIAVNGNFVTIDFDVDPAAVGNYPLVVDANLLDAAGDPVPGVILNPGEVVVPGEVPGEASVSIEPATQGVVAGGSCSVDVVVDSAGTPITACNVTVTFDADLTATGLTGADLLGTFGIDAFYIPLVDVGEFEYGGVRIDGPIAVNGNFVTIDFDVDAAAVGTYPLVVDAILFDADGLTIPGVVLNHGEVVVPGEVPGAATVRIEPETLNLASQGVFTAFIMLPEGYDVADIDVSTVECEGAPAVRGMVAGGKFIAKFNRQDLVNVLPGDEVTLTVTGELTDGTQFEGSDTIRVIDKGGK